MRLKLAIVIDGTELNTESRFPMQRLVMEFVITCDEVLENIPALINEAMSISLRKIMHQFLPYLKERSEVKPSWIAIRISDSRGGRTMLRLKFCANFNFTCKSRVAEIVSQYNN